MNLDGTIVEANRLSLESSGFGLEGMIGRKLWDCGGWSRWPDVVEHVRKGSQQAAKRRLFRSDTPWSTADGSPRFVDLVIAPILNDEGRVAHLTFIGTDVTDRKRSEERDHFLLVLEDALRPLTSADALTLTAARLLGEYLAVDRCAYASIEADEDTMNLAGNYIRRPETRSIVGRLRLGDFGAEALARMRANEPYVVNDVDSHLTPVEDRSAYRAAQIQAVVYVPLHKEGRLAAAMGVHMAVPRVWRPDEVELVRLVAARCWESIERVRVAQALREGEARYREFVTNSSEGVYRLDFDPPIATNLPPDVQIAEAYRCGRIADCNDAFARMYGFERAAEIIGRDLGFTLPPEDERSHAFLRYVIASGYRVYDVESVERDREDEPLYLANSITGVVEEGRLLRAWGIQRNVSERRRSQEALRQSEERYRTLFDSIDEGFCVIEMIFDDAGRPADFRYIEINPAFEKLTGLSAEAALAGKTIRQMVPDYEDFWIQTFGQVAHTGVPAKEVSEVKGLHRWFEVNAARVGGEGSLRVAVVFNDITDRKQSELAQSRLLAELSTEREKLRTMFEQAPAFLALMSSRDLRFEYANAAYLSLVGDREIVGKTIQEALPEVVGQGFVSLLRRVIETGQPYVGSEVSVMIQRDPDAAPHQTFLDFVYQPVREGDGTIGNILVHGVDVTDQVLARQRIVQSEEQFRTVFENAPDAILLLDPERTILGWNPALESITGWTAAEAVGQSGDILFTPEDRAAGAPHQEASKAAESGQALDERWHLRKSGARFWGSGTMNALYHAEGGLRGFLKVFRDATERYEMERQIRQMNKELDARVKERTKSLEETVREAEAFNYSISHDLRSPLRAISATASILLDDLGAQIDATYREMLERQVYNAHRLGRLIDELLRLSRLSRAPVNREVVDMTAKARSLAEEMDPTRRVEVQEGMTGECDRHLVRTVLQNLIGNALKFSPPGSTIWVGKTGDVFWVRDEGIGFDMRYATKLFLPFERLVSEGQFEGTGIGLANVERIVRRHHGRVWAESEPGKGATFFFTLGGEEPA